MAKFILLFSACVICFMRAKCDDKPVALATSVEVVSISEKMFGCSDWSLCSSVKINQKSPLLAISDKDLNAKDTVKALRALFGHFNMDSMQAEITSPAKERDINAFLDAVCATEVIKVLMEFLKKRIDELKGGVAAWKKYLKMLWFGEYSRNKGGKIGSDGMEHVFLFEIVFKNGTPELSGGHNWIHFHDEEMKQTAHASLLTINKSLGLYSKNANLRLLNIVQKYAELSPKPSTTMFTCTTPEYELAIYTLCIALNMEPCVVKIGDKMVTIQWFTFDRGVVRYVASCYPV